MNTAIIILEIKKLIYYITILCSMMNGLAFAEKNDRNRPNKQSDFVISSRQHELNSTYDISRLKVAIGANLQGITDYSRTNSYVNLIHQARRYGSPEQPWDEKAILGDDGWPIGDFGVVLMTKQKNNSEITGIYKIGFSGRAEVTTVATEDATIFPVRYDPITNQSRVDIALGKNTDKFMLKFTNTGFGIKNLKIIRPGYDFNNPPLFTRPFLEHIDRFETLRFMDWLRTNNNPVVYWSDRSTIERTHYATERGVPWEHIIELANQTKKNIWINIPIAANDDYVKQLASLLLKKLNRNIKIYIEYSNEIWNSHFNQHAINFDLAEKEVRSTPNSPLAYDGKIDRWTVGFRRIAKRGKEISDIFRAVYGEKAMMNTVNPIFASQIANPYTTALGLDFLSEYYGPPSQYFFAVAGAPYFNLGAQQKVEGLSTEQVLDGLDGSIKRLHEIYKYEKNVALASWYRLPYFAYEGGPDTFGSGSIPAKKASQLHPRMEILCTTFLENWFASGGGLFMWFTAGAGDLDKKFGAWELTTDLKISNTPKIRCIDKANNLLKTDFPGRNKVPGSFPAIAYVGNYPPYSDKSRSILRRRYEGAYLDYLIMITIPGMYDLVLHAASNKSGNKVNIRINNRDIISDFELQSQGWEKHVANQSIPVRLEKGLHTLRIITYRQTSGIDLSQITMRLQSVP